MDFHSLREEVDRHYRQNNVDLLFIGMGCLIFTLLIIVDIFQAIRQVSAIVILIFPTGYSLLACLYPDRSSLSPAERYFASIALSVSMLIIVGLLLNSSVGLSVWNIWIALCSLNLMFVFIAYVRRTRGGSGNNQPDFSSGDLGKSTKMCMQTAISERGRLSEFATLSLVLSVAKEQAKGLELLKMRCFALLSMTKTSLHTRSGNSAKLIPGIFVLLSAVFYFFAFIPEAQSVSPTTQLFLTNLNGKNNDSASIVSNTGKIRLVVVNRENQPMEYEMVSQVAAGANNHLAYLELDPGQEWSLVYELPSLPRNAKQRITFSLYLKDNASKPYRQVHVWVNNPEQ